MDLCPLSSTLPRRLKPKQPSPPRSIVTVRDRVLLSRISTDSRRFPFFPPDRSPAVTRREIPWGGRRRVHVTHSAPPTCASPREGAARRDSRPCFEVNQLLLWRALQVFYSIRDGECHRSGGPPGGGCRPGSRCRVAASPTGGRTPEGHAGGRRTPRRFTGASGGATLPQRERRTAGRGCPRADPAAPQTLFLGEEGQGMVEGSFVVVVGLGGVGSHAAHMLARAGVRRIRLVDFDNVTLSSLNRHAVVRRTPPRPRGAQAPTLAPRRRRGTMWGGRRWRCARGALASLCRGARWRRW